MAKNLLIELGTEELPPTALKTLSDSFSQSITASLKDAGLAFTTSQSFATPRRLAIVINDLEERQADRQEQKLGPNVKAAFDKDGNPTKAALGFAASCNMAFEDLSRIDTDKGERLCAEQYIAGQSCADLLMPIIENALQQLPIPKRMRWGSSRAEFVRPVKWLALVFGNDVIDATILGVSSSNQSRGHRFHAPKSFSVNADNYQQLLEENFVIADFQQRKELIQEQVLAEAKKLNAHAQISEALLEEVTALVEWPVALTGNFEQRFLEVPAEALISSMVEHQKYFHLLDSNDQLLPHFITVANIQSTNPAQIIDGNERVIRPRLSDAVFFFETDKKVRLDARFDALKKIVFQKQLGTVFEKTQRVSELAGFIADKIGCNVQHAKRAGLLAKSDLVSNMVQEFASLQGLMGMHYALNDGEDAAVATAIYEQYLPKGANDNKLPETLVGAALSLADRIDTLIGIFGIGQIPSGNKDPFALRRQALAILNIIVDTSLDLDLSELYEKSFSLYQVELAADTASKALAYTLERFKAYYQARGIKTEIYLSVASRDIVKPLDFNARIAAVTDFCLLDSAAALASANKRVANIISKQGGDISFDINLSLLLEPAEKALFEALQQQAIDNVSMDYREVLQNLATLKNPIDDFFDNVMVMAEDDNLRRNRIAILAKLRALFLQVADISALATK